ncbi:MAG: translesion error-prone DNA polymerase V autoproteolytic subunit [Hymenobacter sp.]|nr:MAG: translesion error-prone DNA polymerase V autoproteolytic subunit [Hymenobacter sp.]
MYEVERGGNSLILLASGTVHAGFESPAADYEEERINLNEYVSNYPNATFYIKVEGDCMNGSGIYSGDLLVVDRSLAVKEGDIIVAALDGDFVLRIYIKKDSKIILMPDNPNYDPIIISEFMKFEVWGVVPHTILNQIQQRNVRLDRLQQFLRQL